MDCYKVNLDYEQFLFYPEYKENSLSSVAMIKEFEYVFFLINREQCELKNFRLYDEKYLKFLSSLGFIIPQFNPEAKNFINWWGPGQDLEIEKKLNSKLTSASLALENQWGMFDGIIVKNSEDANQWIKKFNYTNWILKNPFGVSGSGNQVYKNQNFSKEHILEPIHQRVFDIGTTFEVREGKLHNFFMVLNSNSRNGSFKGGVGANNVDIFKKYILKNFNYDLSELEEITLKIFKIYQKLGANSNLQIDSYVYLEDEKLKLYPLVEVNYRKTMGLVLNQLPKTLNCNLIEWKVTHTDDYENNIDWKKISPDGNKFKSYVRIIE